MDFDFSEEQAQLREAVRRWVAGAYGFARHRSIVQAGGFDRGAWAELAELGLCGLYVPEAHGGLGLGPVEGMLVMEELGRGLVLEPLGQAFISAAVLAGYAEAGVQSRWLPAIASGEALVVLAWQERAARYRLDLCETRATQVPGGYVLSGTKSLVPAGDGADAFLVPAKVNRGLALFVVERGTSGVKTQGYGTQDGSRAAELVLHNAPATLVTSQGLQGLEHAVDIGIANCCAQGVGVMDQTLAATVEYMNTRKQFGVPIASFQALRHRVADMKIQLELARSMSYYASLKLNAPAAERRQAQARAKYQLGQSMRCIGQQAVQLHGGMGVTDETLVSHYFKQLTQLELSFGDSLHHLGEVADRMQDSAGVFA